MIGLPLLQRELTELAKRRRTYIVRVVAALVLLTLLLIVYETVKASRVAQQGPFASQFMFGIGGDVFSRIVPTLFVAIKALMPALACASITAEKESNTIGTLLLTRLKPGTIVLEKFVSRLVPMLTIIFITFPLIAYAYSLGGVDSAVLFASLWLLLCDCLLVAALSLMCSAWFPTTVGAFICSYVLVGLLVIWGLFSQQASMDPLSVWNSLIGFDNFNMQVFEYYLNNDPNGLERLLPGYMVSFVKVPTILKYSRANPTLVVYMASIGPLILTAIGLLITRLILVKRAFVTQTSVLLRVFRVVDRFFKRLNDRTTGGVELIKESNSLPAFDPIAWRERTKKSLGQARYLFRILVVVEGPTLFICTIAASAERSSPTMGLTILLVMLWVLTLIVVSVKAATLIPSERSKQTLEPLLASPMSTQEILRQKISGMRRLVMVMAIPPATVCLTQVMLDVEAGSFFGFLKSLVRHPLAFIGLNLVAGYLVISIAVWTSAGLGLVIRSHSRSAIAAVVLLAIWWLFPYGLSGYLRATRWDDRMVNLVEGFSPFSLVTSAQDYLLIYGRLKPAGFRTNFEDVSISFLTYPLVQFAIFAVIATVVLLVVRTLVVRVASRKLERTEVESEYESTPDPVMPQANSVLAGGASA